MSVHLQSLQLLLRRKNFFYSLGEDFRYNIYIPLTMSILSKQQNTHTHTQLGKVHKLKSLYDALCSYFMLEKETLNTYIHSYVFTEQQRIQKT